MAHFAKIDNNNIVEQVIVVDNNDIGNLEYPASEPAGQRFIKSIGLTGRWLQTSYNGKFRKNYAGIGYTYSPEYDVFISPKPYASWILDKTVFGYKPPVAPPTKDSSLYIWNEDTKSWTKV